MSNQDASHPSATPVAAVQSPTPSSEPTAPVPMATDGNVVDEAAPVPPPAPTPPANSAPKVGGYGIWTAGADGALLNYVAGGSPNPSDANALEIYFGVRQGVVPPKEQSDLQASISQVLTVVRCLYAPEGDTVRPQFRLYYTRLFRIAQLGLEGNAMPDIARTALDQVADSLIDAEGARVKNAHLSQLGKRSAGLAAAFLSGYLALSSIGDSPAFKMIGVDPAAARSFMLLWIGCFGGVWLSYAIRKTTFTLRDLVVAEADRLLPLTRLVFAGSLTMILGMLLALGFLDVELGGRALSSFLTSPMQALLLGLFCGISELLLPGMVAKKSNDLLTKIQ